MITIFYILLMKNVHPKASTSQNKSHICHEFTLHYNDVIISTIASQITSLTIVYSTYYSGADQREHESSVSLAFVWGIHREFPAQRASNAENVSIWWRYHEIGVFFMTGDGETYDSAAINTNSIGCMCFLTVTVRTNMKRWPSNYSNTTWYTSRHLLGRKCGYFALSW